MMDHLIRSSGHTVQNRPMRSVRWADIPQLSMRSWCCLLSWQQYWQQSGIGHSFSLEDWSP
jgi:hypothetical protein